MKEWDQLIGSEDGNVPVEHEGAAAKEKAAVPAESEEEEVRLEGYKKAPVPYDEEAIPVERRKWVADYHDQLIPERKGFISDFVYHTRGIMTPTLASIWSALYVMQSAIKREAWLQWYPRPMYTNQYIIIIGAAGKVKKTTVVSDVGLPMLKKFRSYIRDRNLYEMKQITIVKDKSTPEALITAMLPENKGNGDYFLQDAKGEWIMDAEGKAIRYTRTSEVSILISELSVMLSKRSYADSMIENLLDLYDPRDEWEWRREGKGIKILRNTCTSLIGGTTVDGFRSSIPNAAKGDGFLSRTVLVYCPDSKRKYPMPFLPEGAPDGEEMAKRLAWVAEHTLGEFHLTNDALQLYNKWYMIYSKRLDDDPSLAGAMSRMDVNVLKTALLLRAGRYEATEPVVDTGDVMDAIKIVEATYMSVPYLIGQLDDDVIMSATAKAEVFLKRARKIARPRFLSGMRIRSDLATLVVQEMIARGEVAVEYKGQRILAALGHSEEEYVWIGGEDDGADAFDKIWTSKNYPDSWKIWLREEGGKSNRSIPHSITPLSTLERGRPSKLGRPKGSHKKT